MSTRVAPVAFAAALFGLVANTPSHAATIGNLFYSDGSRVIFGVPLPGQSFTAVDPNLLSIGFGFVDMNNNLSNDPITLNLLSGDGTGGASLASRTFTLLAVLPTDLDPLTFIDIDFSGVSLTVGNIYTAVLTTNSEKVGVLKYDDDDGFNGGDAYAGGRGYGTGSDCVECDYTFRVIGEGGNIAAVPLPGALPLFAGGVGVIALLARRKKQKYVAARG